MRESQFTVCNRIQSTLRLFCFLGQRRLLIIGRRRSQVKVASCQLQTRKEKTAEKNEEKKRNSRPERVEVEAGLVNKQYSN